MKKIKPKAKINKTKNYSVIVLDNDIEQGFIIQTLTRNSNIRINRLGQKINLR